MVVFPNAKINIGLYVTSRRSDGYHNLETVLVPINLKDVVEVVEGDRLVLSSSGLAIPGDVVNNLCVKAYQLIRKDIEIPPIRIHLHKHIPIGAGLGGGSSDAAFFIKLINEKFSLNLHARQMEHYARQLGADCAFFIRNQPAFATHKGDQFEPIALVLKQYYVVLVVPNIHVSTSQAYHEIIPADASSGLQQNVMFPIAEWKNCIENSFEQLIFKKYPKIEQIKSYLYKAGALYASMSGSGSAVYGIFDNAITLPELEKENQVFYDVGL